LANPIARIRAARTTGTTARPGCPPNGTLMARRPERAVVRQQARLRKQLPTWPFAWERMTGIEPALSAWEFAESVRFIRPDQQLICSLSVRERPPITAPNGPLMARRRAQRAGTDPLRAPSRARAPSQPAPSSWPDDPP
jgi:hypothetical protein